MLLHPTLDLLNTLGLSGMAKGLQDLEAHPEARSLDHAEWLGLLLDQEVTVRRQKRFENRARSARLRHDASVEDVDYQAPRGLDRASFSSLDRATGSDRGAICSSQGPVAWAKVISPVRSAKRRVARISPSFTTVPQASSPC